MLYKSIFFSLFLLLFVSCQSSDPERERLKTQLRTNEELLDNLEDKSDDIEDTYLEIKEDLTELMQREGFLTRRLVREKRRFIKYSNQDDKLSKSIEDQEKRGVDQDLIDINKEIGVYIKDVVEETATYISELEKDLLEVTQQGLKKRSQFEEYADTRQKLQIQIYETKSLIGDLEIQLDN